MEWYYGAGDRHFGPVTFAEIERRFAKGELNASTLIWQEGMADWIPLSTRLSRAAVPPPLPPAPPPLPAGLEGWRPPPPPQPLPSSGEMGGLFPYRNPKALAAYYLGVFSLIPVLGILLAIPALVLGILGVQFAKLHPACRGRTHAFAGIAGAVVSLGYHILIVGLVAFHSRP